MHRDPPPAGLLGWSAVDIAHEIARGHVSAAEVLEAHVQRIEEVNPPLNAVVVRRYDQARADAEAIDAARRRGEPLGPLAGVPMTVKECFDVAGLPSTMGLRRLASRTAAADGVLVRRLRRAGAIIVGKTNVPQLMLLHETDNPLYGRTNNPWDLDRGPGGSSGGEAAIIAAGGVPLGLGSDLGGSIRQPAHSCGIHGIKPTSGRLSILGSVRNLHGMEALRSQAGPLARRVADLALVLPVLLGEWDGDREWQNPPVPWQDPAQVDLRGLRIAYWNDDGFFRPSPAIRRAVAEAADALREQGAHLLSIEPPQVPRAMQLYFGLISADGGANFRRLLQEDAPDPRISRLLRLAGLPRKWRRPVAWGFRRRNRLRLADMVLATGALSTDEYWQLVDERNRFSRDFLDRLRAQQVDGILCPPHALPALTHGSTEYLATAASYCLIPNLLDVPAGVVSITRVRPGEESDRPESRDPADRAASKVERNSAGLPVGVQVAALPWREDVALALMAALERSFSARADYPVPCPSDPAGDGKSECLGMAS